MIMVMLVPNFCSTFLKNLQLLIHHLRKKGPEIYFRLNGY
jgi:hypothetical protein